MSTLTTTLQAATDVLAVQDPGSVQPPGGDNITLVASWAKWIAGIAIFVGLCLAAAQMALSHRRGSGGDHGSALGYVAGAAIILGIGASVLTTLGA